VCQYDYRMCHIMVYVGFLGAVPLRSVFHRMRRRNQAKGGGAGDAGKVKWEWTLASAVSWR
jgi:hypothetical protein